MTSLVWNYLPEYIIDVVGKAFRSGRLILSDSVRGFDEEYVTVSNTATPTVVAIEPG